MRQLRKMGPMTQLLEMLPGIGRALHDPAVKEALEGDQLKSLEAIILSMTPQERRYPEMINGSRKRRIAAGSGTTPQDVNQLLTSFKQMQKMMKQVMATQKPGGRGRLRGLASLGNLGDLGGLGGLGGGRSPFGH
jgi:signal recognition particle subunit SRP54